MMKLDFTYKDYQKYRINYSTKYSLKSTIDKGLYREIRKKCEEQQASVDKTFEELKKRTSSAYHNKVLLAQTGALTYAREVFPAYYYIFPDALTDDWLSTVDWHKKYPTRDHSLHQTLTTYIISKMLGNGDPSKGLMLNKKESLLARCAKLLIGGGKMEYLINYLKRLDNNFEKHQGEYDYDWAVKVFYEAAIIAAQFHDMGYPWSFINTLAKDITHINYDKITGMILKPVQTFNKIKDRLLLYPFFGYKEEDIIEMSRERKSEVIQLIKRGVSETHGMPGALCFMSLNEDARKFKKTSLVEEATSRFILDWAAVGIMMHDMPGLYWGEGKKDGIPREPILRLDFEKDPLSCIISIADILEEFERPFAMFEEKKEKEGKKAERVRVGYGFACWGSSISIENNQLLISYVYNNEKERGDWETVRENEVREYLNLSNGYLDLSSWGIVDVECKTAVLKRKG